MRRIGLLVAALHTLCMSAQTRAAAFGYVTVLAGSATVKRAGTTRYIPLHFGAVVRRGDLLSVASGSSLTIVCSDLTMPAPLPARYLDGVPCTTQSAPLVVDGSAIGSLRGNDPESGIPAVIAPRGGKISGRDFTIRWRAIPSASDYAVTVTGPDVQWSRTVKGTQVRYLTGEQPLLPGRSYSTIVKSGKRTSEQDTQPFRAFTVMTAAERQQLEKDEDRVRKLRLGDPGAAFVIAILYRSRSLHAEAIEILEVLSPKTTEAAVWRALGGAYLISGLHREAELPLLEALRLSETAADAEGIAHARIALGEIYSKRGNSAEAVKQWKAAIAELEKIGNHDELTQLRARIPKGK